MVDLSWQRVSDRTETLLSRNFFSVRSDEVVTPGGATIHYDWVDAPDMVRVAALTGDGAVIVIEQHHYLTDRASMHSVSGRTSTGGGEHRGRTRMWQLPGGAVAPGEGAAEAAARELSEEVGAAGTLTFVSAVWPMPGLSTSRTHLFVARDLRWGRAQPAASEADLVAVKVPLDEAVRAAANGTVGCAPSAQLILAVAAGVAP